MVRFEERTRRASLGSLCTFTSAFLVIALVPGLLWTAEAGSNSQYNLTVIGGTPLEFVQGELIVANYSRLTKATPYDWLGFFQPSEIPSDNSPSTLYQYIPCGYTWGCPNISQTGVVTFSGLLPPGIWRLHYFQNNLYVSAASVDITILSPASTPIPTPPDPSVDQLSTNKPDYFVDEPIVLSFSRITPATSFDFVGIFSRDAIYTFDNRIWWTYVPCGLLLESVGCTFPSPVGTITTYVKLPVGNYQAGYFDNYTLVAIANASFNVVGSPRFPSPSPTPSNCVDPAPEPMGGTDFQCLAGVWTAFTIIVIDIEVVVDSMMKIEGNFTSSSTAITVLDDLTITEHVNINNSSTLSLGQSSTMSIEGSLLIDSSSTLRVSSNASLTIIGCVYVEGTLELHVLGNQSSGSIVVLNVSCGSVSNENVQLIVDGDCKEVTPDSTSIQNSQLVVEYSIRDSSRCKAQGLQPAEIGGIVAAAVILTGIIVLIVLVIKLPSVRRKMFPFRNRADSRVSTPLT